MTANENRRIEEYFYKCSPLEDPQDSPAENEDNERSALTNAANIVKESSPGSPVKSTIYPGSGGGGRRGGLNTATPQKKINEHRITARKVDGTPSPQQLFLAT